MAQLLNQTELADWLGVDRGTVRLWQEGGCPVETRGEKPGEPNLYRLSAVVDWRIARAVENAVGPSKSAGLDEARRRKEVARAEAAEMDLAVRRGELGPIAPIVQRIAGALVAVRASLMGIGSRIAPRLEIAGTAAAMQAIVDSAVSEALHEIARDPRAFVDGDRGLRRASVPGDDGRAGASEAADDQPVG